MSYSEDPRSLIINYLPPALTDDEFAAIFNRVGPINASKIIRNKVTGISYGYGFVEYTSPEDAERAIQLLDGHQLQGKRLKVSHVRVGNDVRASNIYISNLPPHVSEQEMISMFNSYGTIIQARLLTDPTTGMSRGVGFVRYATREEAQRAIESENGRSPDGTSIISVKFAEDNREKAQKMMAGLSGGIRMGAPVMGTNQSVGQPIGVRATYTVPCNNVMGNPRLVGMQQHVGVAQPFAGADQFGVGYQGDIGGGPMRCGSQIRQRFDPMAFGGTNAAVMGGMANMAPPPVTYQNGNSGGYAVFVYNLAPDTDDRALWQLFYRYGALQKVSIVRDPETKMGKGYGFVTMLNLQEAQNAIHNLNGLTYKDRVLQVSLKQPKTPTAVVMPTMNNVCVPAIPSVVPSVATAPVDGVVLFVYNIGTDADERSLWTLFQPFGAILKVSVSRTNDTGVCKGFGFVTMADVQAAQNAIQSLNGLFYKGRSLQVSFKQPGVKHNAATVAVQQQPQQQLQHMTPMNNNITVGVQSVHMASPQYAAFY